MGFWAAAAGVALFAKGEQEKRDAQVEQRSRAGDIAVEQKKQADMRMEQARLRDQQAILENRRRVREELRQRYINTATAINRAGAAGTLDSTGLEGGIASANTRGAVVQSGFNQDMSINNSVSSISGRYAQSEQNIGISTGAFQTATGEYASGQAQQELGKTIFSLGTSNMGSGKIAGGGYRQPTSSGGGGVFR